ncbi:MAG: hypothetical protein ACJAS1_006218 [Oleiphilaceae bacterium]|jgi:hypothetical protein
MFCFDPTINWSTIVQLVGFLVAICTVAYQMSAQRTLQKDKHRLELQAKTYEKIADGMSAAAPTGVVITFQLLHGALINAVEKKTQTGVYVPPPFSPIEIDNDFKRVHSELWKITSNIETYEIVSPYIPLFREALVIKLRQLSNAYLPLVNVLPYLLISEKGINDPENLLIPDEKTLGTLHEKINDFQEVSLDVVSFLYDIRVDLQNSLLGPLFTRTIPSRVPKDDSYLVLTSKDQMMIDRVKAFVRENS